MDLLDLKNLLISSEHPPTARIGKALDVITDAQKAGGEILYLTSGERRILDQGWELRRSLAALLFKVTQGGIEGNPWICQEVRHGAQALADFEGISDKYNVNLAYIANLPSPTAPPPINASSPSNAGSLQDAAPRPTDPPHVCPPHDPGLPLALGAALVQLRALSQAMLGMCDCKAPDQAARDAALKGWIDLRDALDLVLPEKLAGRDLDSSCGD